MSNQLYMDTQAANSVVLEMKDYISLLEPIYSNILDQNTSLLNGNTWVAKSYHTYAEIFVYLVIISGKQQDYLENLIARLEKEIREWEETSQRLGS